MISLKNVCFFPRRVAPRPLLYVHLCICPCSSFHLAGVGRSAVKKRLNWNNLFMADMGVSINPPACRRVWLEGVLPVLFLVWICTCSFVLFLRIFVSSELGPPTYYYYYSYSYSYYYYYDYYYYCYCYYCYCYCYCYCYYCYCYYSYCYCYCCC